MTTVIEESGPSVSQVVGPIKSLVTFSVTKTWNLTNLVSSSKDRIGKTRTEILPDREWYESQLRLVAILIFCDGLVGTRTAKGLGRGTVRL